MIHAMEWIKKTLAGRPGQILIRRFWVVFAIAAIWVFISYNLQTFGINRRVEKSIEHYKAMEEQAVSALRNPNKMIEEMAKKNPFSGAQQAPDMPQCLGIMGQCALFGDQWYKAGETVQDAKIVSIGPSGVKILWQGQEQTLKPFDVEVVYQSSQPAGPMASAATPAGQTAEAAQTQTPMPTMPPMPMMGGRGFNPFNMSPDELARMRDQFMNMSPEERRRAFEEMRGRRGR